MYHPDLIRVITGGANQMPCVKFPGYLYNSLTLLGGILNQGSRPWLGSRTFTELDGKTCNSVARKAET